MPSPKANWDIEQIRRCLELDLVSLLFLRPLISAGFVIPVVMQSWHCIHERDWMEAVASLAHDFAQAAAKFRESEFSIRYQIPQKSPTGNPTLYWDGPERYIEHGGLVGLLKREPRWLPRTARFR